MFDKDECNDYLVTAGDVDESSKVPSMLELAIEYFQKEDPESTAMAYMQSGEVGEEPWAVVMAADPGALIKLVMEIIQQHCPDVAIAMLDSSDDIDDYLDIEDMLGDN